MISYIKIFLILLLSPLLLIISCSNDENSVAENNSTIETIEGTILRSYKYSSGSDYSEIEHFFENNGTRYEKIAHSDGSVFIKYVYDSNNRMTKIIYSPDTTFSTETSFFYNDKGQIVKMEKDTRNKGPQGKLLVWLFTYNNNIVTGELVPESDSQFYHLKIDYTFNNEGLLVSYHDYGQYVDGSNSIIRTKSYLTLNYDSKNQNVVSLKITEGGTHDLPDSPTYLYPETVTYEYDDKINPIHPIYMNHYMNYILSNDYPFNLEHSPFQDRVLGTGTNNLTITRFSSNNLPGGIPVDNDYQNNYTYQLNNLPKRIGRFSITKNEEHSNITYNYIPE